MTHAVVALRYVRLSYPFVRHGAGGRGMATFTVTTATDAVADDGQLSLREAIAQADASAGPDTIRFAPDLEGSTLRLAGGPLVLSGGVTVDGDADTSGDRVTLDAHGASRVLEIAAGDADV